MDINPGDIFQGADSLRPQTIYLMLGRDPIKAGGTVYWHAAEFQWCCHGYMGAPKRLFTDEEVAKMSHIGNISQIKSFELES